MTDAPIVFIILLFIAAFFAGTVGALLGLGGGIVLIPILTLIFHVDFHAAIGVSIVSIIATSSGAAMRYVREHLANLRVGMFLELGTVPGAICGAFFATVLSSHILYVLYGVLVFATAASTIYQQHMHGGDRPTKPSHVADTLLLHDTYQEHPDAATIPYRVQRPITGLFLMFGAGITSALFGVGGGTMKVPALDGAMHLPFKVSTATSNFMIGVTAAASAGIYILRGDVNPYLAGPVALGVLGGAAMGSTILPKMRTTVIRWLFIIILVLVAGDMMWKGLGL